MNQIFHHQEIIQLYHVDAIGRLFYGQIYFIIHNALSAFLKECGFPIKDSLAKGNFIFPIVHSEANYTSPLSVDDIVQIELSIERIGNTSFTVFYYLTCNGKEVGNGKIVHVFLDYKTQKKMSIPNEFKEFLNSYLKEENDYLKDSI